MKMKKTNQLEIKVCLRLTQSLRFCDMAANSCCLENSSDYRPSPDKGRDTKADLSDSITFVKATEAVLQR